MLLCKQVREVSQLDGRTVSLAEKAGLKKLGLISTNKQLIKFSQFGQRAAHINKMFNNKLSCKKMHAKLIS